MSDNNAILYVLIAFAIMTVGLFLLLAWKFGRGSGDESDGLARAEIHVTAP